VSPRRWTLASPNRTYPNVVAYGKGIGMTEEVPVREDIITTEDVRAVAKHLAEIDRGDGVDEYVSGYDDEAHRLLALVLGADKEGEDA
jgi:hypothetical protein